MSRDGGRLLLVHLVWGEGQLSRVENDGVRVQISWQVHKGLSERTTEDASKGKIREMREAARTSKFLACIEVVPELVAWYCWQCGSGTATLLARCGGATRRTLDRPLWPPIGYPISSDTGSSPRKSELLAHGCGNSKSEL